MCVHVCVCMCVSVFGKTLHFLPSQNMEGIRSGFGGGGGGGSRGLKTPSWPHVQ